MSDKDSLQAFFDVVSLGDREAAAKMLDADASLAHATDDEGATALHHAAFNGFREIAEMLVDRGADINARDKTHGATPAGWAIHYLRERGALLAIEIDDLRFALERGDSAWVDRFLARHPWLERYLPSSRR